MRLFMSMAKFDNSLLWELRNERSEYPSYLFGTMHARSEEAYNYFHLAEKYLSGCTVFSGEINLNEGSGNPNNFCFEKGASMKTILDERKYLKHAAKIKKYFGFELDNLCHLKPMIVLNTIMEDSLSKTYGLALDFQLKNTAEALGLTISGVETMKEQEEIFLKIPVALQMKMFVEMTKTISKSSKSFSKLVSFYKNADLSGLYRSSKRTLGGLRKTLLFDRNIIMADRIAQQMTIDKTFFAIGAAHLGGSKGVLNFLAKKGVTAKAIVD